jgi:hypothetical protein
MEFADEGATRSLHLSEADRMILDVQVEVGGSARLVRTPNTLFSVLDGTLIRTVCPTRAFVQTGFRAHGHLTLGDHPMARELVALRLADRPVAATIIQQQRFLMPAGRPIGPAQARPRYEGTDQEFGRFTTRHADGTVVDHYHGLAQEVRPTAKRQLAEISGD